MLQRCSLHYNMYISNCSMFDTAVSVQQTSPPVEWLTRYFLVWVCWYIVHNTTRTSHSQTRRKLSTYTPSVFWRPPPCRSRRSAVHCCRCSSLFRRTLLPSWLHRAVPATRNGVWVQRGARRRSSRTGDSKYQYFVSGEPIFSVQGYGNQINNHPS